MAGVENEIDPNVPPCSWRQLGIFLSATAAVLLAFNVGVGRLLEEEPRVGGSGRVYQKWRLLDLQTEPVDWLILGDSTGGVGANPVVLQEELGGSALNLCIFAHMLVVNDAWMLEEYLQKVGKPKNIILVHRYDIWQREVKDLRPLLVNIPRPYGFWDRYYPPIEVPTSERFDLAVLHLLPPFAKRDTMKGYLANGCKAMPDIFDMGFVVRRQGFNMETRTRPDMVRSQAEAYIHRAKNSDITFTQENSLAFERILQRCREHNIPLYFVASPLYRGLYEDPDFRHDYEASVAEVRRRMAESGAPAVAAFERPALYEAEQLESFDHIIGEEGTTHYSRWIAKAVAERREETARLQRDTVRR